MSIRGIYSTITDIRRQVFTEVARIGYEGGDYSRIEDLPYKIVPGEVAEHRSSIFLERAIVGRTAASRNGLSPRPLDQHAPLAAGVEESARPEKYYEPPLVNILKFACNACPEKRYIVTNLCQNCLAHPVPRDLPEKGGQAQPPRREPHSGGSLHPLRQVRGCLPLQCDHFAGAPVRQGVRYGRHSV